MIVDEQKLERKPAADLGRRDVLALAGAAAAVGLAARVAGTVPAVPGPLLDVTEPHCAADMNVYADCAGHWIKASVAPDGKFTITNSRNGFSKTYTAR